MVPVWPALGARRAHLALAGAVLAALARQAWADAERPLRAVDLDKNACRRSVNGAPEFRPHPTSARLHQAYVGRSPIVLRVASPPPCSAS